MDRKVRGLAALTDEELIAQASANNTFAYPWHEMEMQLRLKDSIDALAVESRRSRWWGVLGHRGDPGADGRTDRAYHRPGRPELALQRIALLWSPFGNSPPRCEPPRTAAGVRVDEMRRFPASCGRVLERHSVAVAQGCVGDDAAHFRQGDGRRLRARAPRSGRFGVRVGGEDDPPESNRVKLTVPRRSHKRFHEAAHHFEHRHNSWSEGAALGNRTPDLRITSASLFRLS